MSDPIHDFTSLRERNAFERKRHIRETARRIIIDAGVEALSMRHLADEAGLAVKTLYNQYGSRGAILRALSDETLDRMDAALDAEAPLDDPLERCRAIVTVSIRMFVGNAALMRAITRFRYGSGVGSDNRSEAGPSETQMRATRLQAVAIQAAMDRGLLRADLDPMVLGSQVLHGYRMAQLQWATGAIDAAGFEQRALYGLYVALLAVATPAVRARLLDELNLLQDTLAASMTTTSTDDTRTTTTDTRAKEQ